MTGVDGFVGQYLMPSLEATGHTVAGCDRDTIDIRDARALRQVLSEFAPDAVIHLAAISFIPGAAAEPELTEQINIGGTQNLVDGMLAVCPDARLLQVGSSEQYPSTNVAAPPLSEESPLTGSGAYAESKTAAENVVLEAAEKGLDVVRVRAFNHTGPAQPPHFVVPDFSRQIAMIEAGAPPRIQVGNLESVRDFLHVRDVVDAYTRLLDPQVPANVYNVASGRATRIAEVLDILLEMSDVPISVEVDPKKWRESDSRVGDNRRLRQHTQWEPRCSVRDILDELLTYWRQAVAPHAKSDSAGEHS
ncbi:MAG: GDP-mannose 4,6-dehydratase [Myxococcota bacterium]|nr:GDP-mannose 4,6-dehydratase [Myxococcota bacterium]